MASGYGISPFLASSYISSNPQQLPCELTEGGGGVGWEGYTEIREVETFIPYANYLRIYISYIIKILILKLICYIQKLGNTERKIKIICKPTFNNPQLTFSHI